MKNTHEANDLKNVVDALQKDLQKEHEQILQNRVLPVASKFATNLLAAGNTTSIEPYVSSFKAKYQKLKVDVSIALKGSTQKIIGSVALEAHNEKIRQKEKELYGQAELVRNLALDEKDIYVDANVSSYRMHRSLLWLFGFAESALNFFSFLGIGDIFLFAAGIGAVIGLAQIHGIKAIVLFIREQTNREKQRRYLKIAIISVTAVSLVFGCIRQAFAQKTHHTGFIDALLYSGLFAFINMVFVAAAALLVYRYFPTEVEERKLEQLKEIGAKKKTERKAHKTMMKEREQLIDERKEIIRSHAEIVHDEQQLHAVINRYYDESVGIFKAAFIERSGGSFPSWFNTKHEPLSPISEFNRTNFSNPSIQ